MVTRSNGGADGIQTHDLLDAIEARSQLRHGPTRGTSQSLTQIGGRPEWRVETPRAETRNMHIVSKPFCSGRECEALVTTLQVFHRDKRQCSSRMHLSWQNLLFWARQVA